MDVQTDGWTEFFIILEVFFPLSKPQLSPSELQLGLSHPQLGLFQPQHVNLSPSMTHLSPNFVRLSACLFHLSMLQIYVCHNFVYLSMDLLVTAPQLCQLESQFGCSGPNVVHLCPLDPS